jgi:phosphoserine aminotransferase
MRIHNFNAGPAVLPLAVLDRAQRELIDYPSGGKSTGMSIMEHSHRGKAYEAAHNDTIARLRRLVGIDDSYEVLFLQGGASLQFAMVPMNFLPADKSADYVITGAWSQKAHQEAKRIGKARIAADMHVDGVCKRIPKQAELELDKEAAYVHLTSNNTIFGTQWHAWPDLGSVPAVVDMSSDFLWKPIEMDRFAMIYAGAQKNVGPSGLVVAIVKKSLIAGARKDIPTILRYATHAENNSLYNTPNTWGIYVMGLVLEHLEEQGGLPAMEKRNRDKAALLYDTFDADPDFFRSPIDKDARSTMNVVFRLPSEDLENKFLKEAQGKGFEGLKGHRSVGGCRASIYNACPRESVEALVEFMLAFRKTS